MSAPPIRVVIVEDHMVAEAIVHVTARAHTMALALDEVGRHRPDVVVLDRRLPDGDGLELIGELAALGARLLVLTAEATAAVATRVAEAGGSGLLLEHFSIFYPSSRRRRPSGGASRGTCTTTPCRRCGSWTTPSTARSTGCGTSSSGFVLLGSTSAGWWKR